MLRLTAVLETMIYTFIIVKHEGSSKSNVTDEYILKTQCKATTICTLKYLAILFLMWNFQRNIIISSDDIILWNCEVKNLLHAAISSLDSRSFCYKNGLHCFIKSWLQMPLFYISDVKKTFFVFNIAIRNFSGCI